MKAIHFSYLKVPAFDVLGHSFLDGFFISFRIQKGIG